MKYQRTILLFALCTAVAACGVPNATISYGKNGSVVLQNNQVALQIDGIPTAAFGSAGDLSIDSKPVSITPADQGLLVLYYQSVLAAATEMRSAGAQSGLSALKNTFKGDSNASDGKKPAEEGTQKEYRIQLKICQDEANIKTVQDQLAAQLPAFRPYGNIVSGDSVAKCQKNAMN